MKKTNKVIVCILVLVAVILLAANIAYAQKQAVLIVKHMDWNTLAVIETEEYTGDEGDIVNTKSKEIPDYKLYQKPSTETYTLSSSKKEVRYYYKHKSEGVIFRYIDITTGKSIIEDTKRSGYEGDSYSSASVIFDNYKLIKEPSNANGKFKIELTEVNYYYVPKSAGVTVNYRDSTTGDIIESKVIEGWTGEEYRAEAEQIDRYELVESPKNEQGKFTKYPIELDYYYIYIGQITVKHIDEATGDVLKQDVLQGHEGESVTTSKKEIDYYEFVEGPQTEEYQYTKEDREVVYKYRKLNFNIGVQEIINKIVVNGEEKEFNDTLAKVEIPKEQTQNDIRIFYTIKVSNNGEIAGGTEVVSVIPEGYELNSEENKNWEISGNTVKLNIENLGVGEEKEYQLILTNTDKEKIEEVVNEVSLQNITSVANFEDTVEEDNKASTQAIITIQTGLRNFIKIIGVMLLILVFCAIILYMKKRKGRKV